VYGLSPDWPATLSKLERRHDGPLDLVEDQRESDGGDKYGRQELPSQRSHQYACESERRVPTPRIILADEPSAALDPERAGIVMDLLRKLAAEQKAAIIAVTHDEKILGRFDRTFRLRDGRLDG
jgi:ABC-type arginine transport system ATPase subunit